MFTGIVEEVGVIRQIRRGAHSSVLTIGAETVLSDLKIGDSVAVNGVCLTATSLGSGFFTADVMHETLRRSSLGSLTSGSRVNLERATLTAPAASPPPVGTTTPCGTPWRPRCRCCATSWKRAPSPSTASV